ncbi:MAG: Cupin 2 conserved barrel domain protein [Acidimicrobiales bacterium]|nr:Cupin 2 conserved barrel domain protein [Acidimicrobiales bacterium]
MTGWVQNIEDATIENTNFRTVLFTGQNMQLTVMSIKPGEEIGVEMHDHLDQFLRVEQGRGRVTMGPSKDEVAETYDIEDDWATIIPGGTWHNVINTGDEDLRLYSLYSPPEHPEGTVHRTKADADADEHDH